MCKSGLKVRSTSVSCLGDPSMGMPQFLSVCLTIIILILPRVHIGYEVVLVNNRTELAITSPVSTSTNGIVLLNFH